MPISCEKLAGPGYRLAYSLNGERKGARFFTSGPEHRLVSSPKLRCIRLTIDAEEDNGTVGHAMLAGPDLGRVQVPVKSSNFSTDLASTIDFAIRSAREYLTGAEPGSFYRKNGTFNFYFSRDPVQHVQGLLDRFIDPTGLGWNDSFRTLLFYPTEPNLPTRQLDLFDVWLIDKIAEKKPAPKEIAWSAGVSENRISAQVDRINQLRRNWGTPRLQLG